MNEHSAHTGANLSPMAQLGTAVLAGLLAAVLCALAGTSPALGGLCILLSPIPLFMAGLALGTKAGILSALVSFVALAFSNPGVGLVYAILMAVPVALITALALQFRVDALGTRFWSPPGRVVMALLLYILLVMITGFLFSGVSVSDWQAALDSMRAELPKQMSAGLPADISDAERGEIEKMAQDFLVILPAFSMIMWATTLILCGLFAQFLVRMLKRNMRPGFTFLEVSYPKWLAGALALALLGVFLATQDVTRALFTALSGILALPYALLGIGVVHAFARRHMAARLWILIPFYILLSIFLWPLGLLLVVLGLAESWLELQRRLQEYSAVKTAT